MRPPEPVPFVPWDRWFPYFARNYRVSPTTADHLTIIGPNGTGKTTLAFHIVNNTRRYVIAFGTKPKDADFVRAARGYYRQVVGKLPDYREHPHVLIWPSYRGLRDQARQATVFRQAMDEAFSVGGWHLLIDEAPHFVDIGLKREMVQHLRMARTSSSGMVLCAQRPVFLPREAFTQCSHLLMFGTNDDDDLKRLGGLNGADARRARYAIANLGRNYDFLHVDTRTGDMSISRLTLG